MEHSAWLEAYTALAVTGIRGADTVIAPTRWMLEALNENFPLPRGSRVIPNGRTVCAAEFAPERKLQAVTAGRLWDEAKNVTLLAEVQCTVPMFVAGDAQYDSQAFSGMNSAITLLGWMDEDALLRLFRQSALYVCTSRYEPFGLAPLEAAMCGCAVLANDIPSLREVWGDGALYFNNASTLSAQLEYLSNHPDQLAKAQQASGTRARRYTAAAMVEQYATLYQTLLRPSTAIAHAT
jgi:glycogen(starch) synthase